MNHPVSIAEAIRQQRAQQADQMVADEIAAYATQIQAAHDLPESMAVILAAREANAIDALIAIADGGEWRGESDPVAIAGVALRERCCIALAYEAVSRGVTFQQALVAMRRALDMEPRT